MTARFTPMRPLAAGGILFALTLLGACSGNDVQETLGMNRVPPDEFRVVSRPPLTVPPQFSLLPPTIDADSPGQVQTRQQARDIVLGPQKDGDASAKTMTSADETLAYASPAAGNKADSRFLMRAGANEADPNIRRELVEARITKQIKEEDESWWETLSVIPKSKDPTVNAAMESERIQENQDAGKPVTEGETPVVKPRELGVLGKLLGDD